MSAAEIIQLRSDTDHGVPSIGDGQPDAPNIGPVILPLVKQAEAPIRVERANLSEITPVDKLRFLTRMAADGRLNETDLRCAIMIADYFNRDKKRAWPSYARLVKDTGASRAGVARSIRKLDELGLIHRERGHMGRSNSYVPDFLALKSAQATEAAHFQEHHAGAEPPSHPSQPRDGSSISGETTSISAMRHNPTRTPRSTKRRGGTSTTAS
jgi:hypothetical protein